nr:unnamed protein product [Spirometra erinaceieuropaei]
MGTQHSSPGSIVCVGAGVEATKDNQLIRLRHSRQKCVPVLLEFVPYNVRAVHRRSVDADDGGEFASPRRGRRSSTVAGDDAHPVPHGADAGQRLGQELVSSEADLRSIYRTLLSHSPGSDGKTAPRRQAAGQNAEADRAKQADHACRTRPGLQYVYQARMRGSGRD